MTGDRRYLACVLDEAGNCSRWNHDHPPVTPTQTTTDAARARVREWVEREVRDWYDPVIEPDLHDALRVLVGLPQEKRDS